MDKKRKAYRSWRLEGYPKCKEIRDGTSAKDRKVKRPPNRIQKIDKKPVPKYVQTERDSPGNQLEGMEEVGCWE